MGRYRLPLHVEARMISLLDDGAARFGQVVRDRYARLIIQAMRDVADKPYRPGVTSELAIDSVALFYHLRHSRMRAGPPNNRIGKPRHILVYEVASDGVVDILGLIPDSMPFDLALARFVPEL